MMDYVTLRTGAHMPLIGLGTWLSKPGDVEAAVEQAIRVGYRLIDTAWAYSNEKEIGKAITKCIRNGIVQREELFITTKLWTSYYKHPDVKSMLKKSLLNLEMDYVDLYLIHLPSSTLARSASVDTDFHVMPPRMFEHVNHVETWQGMEEVYKLGLTRAIGLSNFNTAEIQKISDNSIVKPHNHQVELHAYWPQFEMQEFCQKRRITLTSYGPFGSPGTKKRLSNPQELFSKKEKSLLCQLDEPTVTEIAAGHNKTPAQVLIRWLTQRNICTIPKTVSPQSIEEYFRVFDFKLSEAQMQVLNNLTTRKQLFSQHHWFGYSDDKVKDEQN